MKVLVIQPKIGMGDMVIYLPYIHAISKKYQTPEPAVQCQQIEE